MTLPKEKVTSAPAAKNTGSSPTRSPLDQSALFETACWTLTFVLVGSGLISNLRLLTVPV